MESLNLGGLMKDNNSLSLSLTISGQGVFANCKRKRKLVAFTVSSLFLFASFCLLACGNGKGNTTYKVEHWQQNLKDDKYKFIEDEQLKGKSGKKTQAKPKDYAGFVAKSIEQKTIEADETTLVKVYYDRKEISLLLDTDGGSVEGENITEVESKHVIKGRFESDVPNLARPTKDEHFFTKWEPELPKTFPAQDSTYVAKWAEAFKMKVMGDHRTEQATDAIKTVFAGGTWGESKAVANNALVFKKDWAGGDYAGYEWHLNDEKGEELTDAYKITSDITVYAITNYKGFNMQGELLAGVKGSAPAGKIYIPKETLKVREHAFGLDNAEKKKFHDITSISFKGCKAINSIDTHAFNGMKGLLSVEFPDSVPLSEIGSSAFSYCSSLQHIDFKGCYRLSVIENNAFYSCAKLENIDFSPCKNLSKLGEGVFTGCDKLKSVSFSGCLRLSKLEREVFSGCASMTKVDFTGCSSLESIGIHTFSGCSSLENIDLSPCNNLQTLAAYAFHGNIKATITLPASIKKISKAAFGTPASLCKAVIVPNEAIKALVKDSGYPEEKITIK